MEETVTLSTESQKALQRGESVPVIEVATQMRCVVVRADVFERIKNDVSGIDPREAYPAVDEVMRADWSEPRMSEYDDYESRNA